MRTIFSLILAGSIVFGGVAQAQVSGIVQGLTGAQGPVTTTLGGLTPTTVPLLGKAGLAAPSTEYFTGFVSNQLHSSQSLNGLAIGSGQLPGLELSDSLPLPASGSQLAGNLPSMLMVPTNLLSPDVVNKVTNRAIIALPAGALPASTLIPVANLGGLDQAVAKLAQHGQIAAGSLPSNLPVFNDTLDPTVVSAVLAKGIPAGLLPSSLPIPADALPGL